MWAIDWKILMCVINTGYLALLRFGPSRWPRLRYAHHLYSDLMFSAITRWVSILRKAFMRILSYNILEKCPWVYECILLAISVWCIYAIKTSSTPKGFLIFCRLSMGRQGLDVRIVWFRQIEHDHIVMSVSLIHDKKFTEITPTPPNPLWPLPYRPQMVF